MSVAEFDITDVEIPAEVLELGDAGAERWLEWVAINGGLPADRFAEDLAIMFARRRGPGSTGTDGNNFRGVAAGNPFPNMPESLRQHYIKQAREQGVSFQGKVYKSSLVRPEFKGRFDPEALVGDTAEAKARLRSRGWSSDGTIKVDAPEHTFDKPSSIDREYDVADDLVDERVAVEVVENHGGRIKKKDYADLRAKVKARLKGKL